MFPLSTGFLWKGNLDNAKTILQRAAMIGRSLSRHHDSPVVADRPLINSIANSVGNASSYQATNFTDFFCSGMMCRQ